MDEDVRKRPETGVMRFNDDWPGVFLRGDDAFRLARALEGVLRQVNEDQAVIEVLIVKNAIRFLNACVMQRGNEPDDTQHAKLVSLGEKG